MGKVRGALFWAVLYGGFFEQNNRGGALIWGGFFEKYQKKGLTCFL